MTVSPSLYCRTLPDGRLLTVEPCPRHGPCLTLGTPALIDDLWLYADLPTALAAARAWDGVGDPPGWRGHPQSGRTPDRPDHAA